MADEMVGGFDFRVPTRVSFGAGVSEQLSRIVEAEGWSSIGVVVDGNLASHSSIDGLLSRIETNDRDVIVEWFEAAEPTYDMLEQVRLRFADHALQCMVGIGGGSTLDTAKAMAVLVHNREPAIAYRGFDRMTEPVLPIVAIPTTAGTGSEVTPNASFVDTDEMRKMGINGEAVRPAHALLDPVLTTSCPRNPTVSAGADSIVHAVEAYVAKKSTPLARLFAREGFRRVYRSLPVVVKEPTDLPARSEVMYGAFLSGLALMHSGTGPAAAMSYPLGVRFGVPHGFAGAVFLPAVAGWNVERGVTGYAELYNALADDTEEELPPPEAAARFPEALRRLWTELRLPLTLEEVGVSAEDVEVLIKETLELRAALEQNPVPFTRSEVTAIARALS